MFWQAVKKFMPRSLYGRGALILIVPILGLQLLVSVVFIQRHFDQVTRQMAGAVAAELAYLVREVNRADTLVEAQAETNRLEAPLGFAITLPDPTPVEDRRRITDWTGPIVVRVLSERVPGLSAVDLVSGRVPGRGRDNIFVQIETDKGMMRVVLNRSRVSASNPHQLLVVMLGAGALMTLVSYVFLRNQLRPIKRLAVAAEAFGKGRHVPYKLAGATEVRSAGRAFLSMRSRLERQIEERTAMLSGVSHDLRTPLTRMKLELSLMEEGETRDALARDVGDMERLVASFLAFARDQARDDDPVETDPAELVRRVVERAGPKVSLGAVPMVAPVPLRPLAIERALDNLISNACRHAETVRVTLEARPARLAFIVADDGPGIPPEQRDEALKPFTRLDTARNQDKGSGVGLGLAIASDVARGHGGQLILGQSEALGGLSATLLVPR